MLWNKLISTQAKLIFLPIGYEQQCKKYLSLFSKPLAVEIMQSSKSARNLGVASTRISPFGPKSLRFASPVFTTSCICIASSNMLSMASAHFLATALIGSQLDYCTLVSIVWTTSGTNESKVVWPELCPGNLL